MDRHLFRFFLALETQDGQPLGGPWELVDLDDEPARECARFQSFLRRGTAVASPVTVVPRWDEKSGKPYVGGLRVLCDGIRNDVPRRFFEAEARRYSRQLLAEGVLQKGDLFRYVITARTGAQEAPAPAGLCIDVVEEPMSWRFLAAAPEDLVEAPVVPAGDEFGYSGDVPVYLPEHVLDEASELTLRNPEVETGGILIGYLCRHAESGRAGLVVAAQIAATETEAGEAHLTFTPRTWAAVHHALALRRDGSLIVGWWHSHPASQWCKPDCAEEARANCPLNRSFFSEMDVNVHRTVFCQGYSVALVLTNTENGIKHALYGWRNGLVQRRAFHVTGCRMPAEAYAAACEEPAVSRTGCVSQLNP